MKLGAFKLAFIGAKLMIITILKRDLSVAFFVQGIQKCFLIGAPID